jgi:uncharacterized protein (DUF488 family)
MAEPRICSVGYEGLHVGGLADRLVQSGIRALVDVRLNAVSRRKGFSKSALAGTLEEADIRYLHDPRLGNPAENRESFLHGDGSTGRANMCHRLENGSRKALEDLVALTVEEKRIAVLSVERDRTRCHRQVVTDMAQELDPEIEVLHLL